MVPIVTGSLGGALSGPAGFLPGAIAGTFFNPLTPGGIPGGLWGTQGLPAGVLAQGVDAAGNPVWRVSVTAQVPTGGAAGTIPWWEDLSILSQVVGVLGGTVEGVRAMMEAAAAQGISTIDVPTPRAPTEQAAQAGETGKELQPPGTPRPETPGGEPVVETSGWPTWAKLLIPFLGVAAVAAILGHLGELPTYEGTTTAPPPEEPTPPPVPPPPPPPEGPGPRPVPPPLPIPGETPRPPVEYHPAPLPTQLTVPSTSTVIPATTPQSRTNWADALNAIGKSLLQGQNTPPGLGNRVGSSGLANPSMLTTLFQMQPYMSKGTPTLGQLLAGGR
jgi:hypothetical protein